MFDFDFNWNDQIEIGIEEIDLQHQELFKIAREIEQLLIIQCIGIEENFLLQVVCDLRNYITYHFYQEELLISKINNSQLEKHRQKHEEFKKKINSIDCIDLCERPNEVLREIKEMLQDWVFEHILNEDREALNRNVK